MARHSVLPLLLAATVVFGACSDGDNGTALIDPTVVERTTTSSTTGDDPAPTINTTNPSLAVNVSFVGGAVVGGVQTKVVPAGMAVRLQVASDVAEEVHVHGYDLSADAVPGTPAVIEFIADLAGVWEVELEESGTPLLELQVE